MFSKHLSLFEKLRQKTSFVNSEPARDVDRSDLFEFVKSPAPARQPLFRVPADTSEIDYLALARKRKQAEDQEDRMSINHEKTARYPSLMTPISPGTSRAIAGGILKVASFIDNEESDFSGYKPLAQITFLKKTPLTMDLDVFDAKFKSTLEQKLLKLSLYLEGPVFQDLAKAFIHKKNIWPEVITPDEIGASRSIYFVYARTTNVPDVQTIFRKVIQNL
jgi:hypothetical protein